MNNPLDVSPFAAPSVVAADVKSSFLSKINWTQAVGVGVSCAVVLGCNKCDMPVATQAELVLAIQSLQGVATWIMRTWFTTRITAASSR
jgi:hypothetical protein